MTADAAGLTEFYDFTRRLLVDAKTRRDLKMLGRANDRINSERFRALSQSRKDELLELFGAAAAASGMGAA